MFASAGNTVNSSEAYQERQVLQGFLEISRSFRKLVPQIARAMPATRRALRVSLALLGLGLSFVPGARECARPRVARAADPFEQRGGIVTTDLRRETWPSGHQRFWCMAVGVSLPDLQTFLSQYLFG